MRKHPKFLPPNYGRKKRVKIRWRKPRGIDNKKRVGKKIMGASPKIGWRSARNNRGIHPSGAKEVLIRSLKDLDGISNENVAIRIASAVGAKKREAIIKAANERKIPVLNPSSMKHQKK